MKPLSPRAQKALLDYRREHALPASVRARVLEQLAKQQVEPSLEQREPPTRTHLPGEARPFLRLLRWTLPALGLIVGSALWLRSPPLSHAPEGTSPALRVAAPPAATPATPAAEPLAASPASGTASSAPRSASKGRVGRAARVEPSRKATPAVAAPQSVPAARFSNDFVAEQPEPSPSQEQARLAVPPASSQPATNRASEEAAHYTSSSISARAQAKPEPPPRASLDEEVLQMRTAYDYLRAGDPLRALSALSEHARRFPDGKLVAMGKVARIQALCDLGKRNEASAEAARFLAEHADSPYAVRVRKVCVARSAVAAREQSKD